MTRCWRIANRICLGLAFLASLALAILPSGQIPKVAGPCGQALCNCPIELTVERNFDKHCVSCSKGPVSVVTLVSLAVSGADAPGLAFQLAVGAVEAPSKVNVPIAHANRIERATFCYEFAVSETSTDIPTPPPRA